jgi:hypothetical protein
MSATPSGRFTSGHPVLVLLAAIVAGGCDIYEDWSFEREVDKAEAKAKRKSAIKLELIRRQFAQEDEETRDKWLSELAAWVCVTNPGESVEELVKRAREKIGDGLRARFRHYDPSHDELQHIDRMADRTYLNALRVKVEAKKRTMLDDLRRKYGIDWPTTAETDKR